MATAGVTYAGTHPPKRSSDDNDNTTSAIVANVNNVATDVNDKASQHEANASMDPKLPGPFASIGSIVAVVVSFIVVATIVAAAWVAGPPEQRSVDHLRASMTALGEAMSAGGWGIIALAVALIAIAMTLVTIVGLRDPDSSSERRRSQVMSLAASFVFIAQGIFSGVTVAAMVGFLGMAVEAEAGGVFSKATGLFLVAAVSGALWLGTQSWLEHLRRIALSDVEQQKQDLSALSTQNDIYHSIREQLRPAYEKIFPTTKQPAHSLRRVTFGAAVAAVIYVLLGSALAASLVWISPADAISTPDAWNRFWGVFAGALLLLGMQMIFSVMPYLFSTHYLKVEKKGIKRFSKFFGSLVFSGPVCLLVPFAALFSQYARTDTTPWKMWVLSGIIIGIPILAVWWPKKYSWRAVAHLRAWSEVADRIKYIEKRQAELAHTSQNASSTHTSESTTTDNHEKIIKLLERLVELEHARPQQANVTGRGWFQRVLRQPPQPRPHPASSTNPTKPG